MTTLLIVGAFLAGAVALAYIGWVLFIRGAARVMQVADEVSQRDYHEHPEDDGE